MTKPASARRLIVFNNLSFDGFFTDKHDDMSWAHRVKPDAEFSAFVGSNAEGGGMLVFGRITYELMAGFWPTPAAEQAMPQVAAGMNAMPKLVFSTTLTRADWNNTTLLKGAVASELTQRKAQPGPDLVVMGSGTIVSQLAEAGLVDEYQLVYVPLILGAGRTLFAGVKRPQPLTVIAERSFANGNRFVRYQPQR